MKEYSIRNFENGERRGATSGSGSESANIPRIYANNANNPICM
jgi:hypothetical protein